MAKPIAIKWSFNLSIVGGPQLSESEPTVEADAYDYITQVLAAGSGAINFPLQPSASGVVLVAILADKYSTPVTYTIDGAAPTHVLDSPHIFLGAGAVTFLGGTPPKVLNFTNPSAGSVTVRVLVGRTV